MQQIKMDDSNDSMPDLKASITVQKIENNPKEMPVSNSKLVKLELLDAEIKKDVETP